MTTKKHDKLTSMQRKKMLSSQMSFFPERTIGLLERPYEVLQQWGKHMDEVKFFLHYPPAPVDNPLTPDGSLSAKRPVDTSQTVENTEVNNKSKITQSDG